MKKMVKDEKEKQTNTESDSSKTVRWLENIQSCFTVFKWCICFLYLIGVWFSLDCKFWLFLLISFQTLHFDDKTVASKKEVQECFNLGLFQFCADEKETKVKDEKEKM